MAREPGLATIPNWAGRVRISSVEPRLSLQVPVAIFTRGAAAGPTARASVCPTGQLYGRRALVNPQGVDSLPLLRMLSGATRRLPLGSALTDKLLECI